MYGPPGTEVEIFTENLPLQAKVHLGIGATRTGFEALIEAEQGMWGEVGGTIATSNDGVPRSVQLGYDLESSISGIDDTLENSGSMRVTWQPAGH